MIRVTSNRVEIDTKELRAIIVDGVVKAWKPKIPTVAEDDIAKARGRGAVCSSCDQAGAVKMTVRGRPVYNVRCRMAGRCVRVSLINGKCPKKKWPIG